jgi:hypothetical protein
VFPVRYELDSYILFRRYSIFEGLMETRWVFWKHITSPLQIPAGYFIKVGQRTFEKVFEQCTASKCRNEGIMSTLPHKPTARPVNVLCHQLPSQ